MNNPPLAIESQRKKLILGTMLSEKYSGLPREIFEDEKIKADFDGIAFDPDVSALLTNPIKDDDLKYLYYSPSFELQKDGITKPRDIEFKTVAGGQKKIVDFANDDSNKDFLFKFDTKINGLEFKKLNEKILVGSEMLKLNAENLDKNRESLPTRNEIKNINYLKTLEEKINNINIKLHHNYGFSEEYRDLVISHFIVNNSDIIDQSFDSHSNKNKYQYALIKNLANYLKKNKIDSSEKIKKLSDEIIDQVDKDKISVEYKNTLCRNFLININQNNTTYKTFDDFFKNQAKTIMLKNKKIEEDIIKVLDKHKAKIAEIKKKKEDEEKATTLPKTRKPLVPLNLTSGISEEEIVLGLDEKLHSTIDNSEKGSFVIPSGLPISSSGNNIDNQVKEIQKAQKQVDRENQERKEGKLEAEEGLRKAVRKLNEVREKADSSNTKLSVVISVVGGGLGFIFFGPIGLIAGGIVGVGYYLFSKPNEIEKATEIVKLAKGANKEAQKRQTTLSVVQQNGVMNMNQPELNLDTVNRDGSKVVT